VCIDGDRSSDFWILLCGGGLSVPWAPLLLRLPPQIPPRPNFLPLLSPNQNKKSNSDTVFQFFFH
jgi:hypothetical protein